MHKYFNLIEIINSIKIDNNNDLREIFDTALNYEFTDTALNYEFTESETPIEFKEDNIQRILVNSIRHSYSNYEEGLKNVHRLKSEDNYFRYKNATLERIAREYSTLRDECERQKHTLNIATIVSEETH